MPIGNTNVLGEIVSIYKIKEDFIESGGRAGRKKSFPLTEFQTGVKTMKNRISDFIPIDKE
jgi:hypothetical protein